MKNTRFFLTLLLGILLPVLAKAQAVKAVALEVEYLGYYEAEDQSVISFVSVYNEEDHGFLDYTEDQKKKCSFVFGLQNSTDMEVMGLAVPKGSNYTSVVAEGVPVLNFEFSFDGTTRTVTVTDKAGKKYVMNQITFEDEYAIDDEYSDSEDAYEPYTDGESIEFDSGLDIRGYQRSDGASLSVIFGAETSCAFILQIPATKTCPEVSIMSAFDEPFNEAGIYTYTEEENGHFVMKVTQVDNTMKFECISGDCYDKKGKCGIWKEAFVQGD